MKQLQTKEEAIQTVKENNLGYYELGYNYACKWVAEKMKPFTSEDLSSDMYLVLGVPEESRVLGAIILALRKDGRIKHNGYVKYKAKQGHGKPASQWLSREYSQRQSQNASNNSTLKLDL
jgi:hypothetical protein